MELFNILENKIQTLLDEVKSLRSENQKLRDELSLFPELVEENSNLQKTLTNEKNLREEGYARINALLEKVNSELN